MILDDIELKERLSSEDNIINLLHETAGGLKVVPVDNGEIGKRGPAVPDVIRKLIANVANQTDETKTEVASVFGVGVPLVSNASRGLVHNRLDEELQQIANQSKEQKTETAHNLALDSLVASLSIVRDRLPEADSLKEAAKIAKDLSHIVDKLRPEEDEGPKIRTLVVIKNMPNTKSEKQFDVIDV